MRTKVMPVLLAVAASTGILSAKSNIIQGNPNSTVKVQIYEDLQCGDCARFLQMMEEKILPRYGTRVAFIHRDFPLAKHDWARTAAIAGRWVYEHDPQTEI